MVSLPVAMAGIHQSACQYASVLLQVQPFSPQTYMEFIAYFSYHYRCLYKQWQNQATRYLSTNWLMDEMFSSISSTCSPYIRYTESYHLPQESSTAVFIQSSVQTCLF